MTQREYRADNVQYPRWIETAGNQESEIGRPSTERVRAANEVGAAIAHQLNGPLTALLLYVAEIRDHHGKSSETAGSDGSIQQLVDGAFREAERACAMMKQMADSFEGPLYPETAATLGREAISWWARNGEARARNVPLLRSVASHSIQKLLTPREREALKLIAGGCSNKQGAQRMRIGPRTFESHRAEVMRKLGAKNAADLVRIALGAGQ
jgi:DNA-binding CsgD family transcriptional regulator